jgi:hypothetical protein
MPPLGFLGGGDLAQREVRGAGVESGSGAQGAVGHAHRRLAAELQRKGAVLLRSSGGTTVVNNGL